MSEDYQEPVPEEEPFIPEEIRPIPTEGAHLYYRSPMNVDPVQKVDVKETKNVIDDHVSTPALLWTGLKSLMATAIVITKASSSMATTDVTPTTTVTVNTKRWYESKTLWLNGLTMVWYFIGPMVGIPLLSAEVTGVILTGANILLRAITKSPVTIE